MESVGENLEETMLLRTMCADGKQPAVMSDNLHKRVSMCDTQQTTQWVKVR